MRGSKSRQWKIWQSSGERVVGQHCGAGVRVLQHSKRSESLLRCKLGDLAELLKQVGRLPFRFCEQPRGETLGADAVSGGLDVLG